MVAKRTFSIGLIIALCLIPVFCIKSDITDRRDLAGSDMRHQYEVLGQLLRERQYTKLFAWVESMEAKQRFKLPYWWKRCITSAIVYDNYISFSTSGFSDRISDINGKAASSDYGEKIYYDENSMMYTIDIDGYDIPVNFSDNVESASTIVINAKQDSPDHLIAIAYSIHNMRYEVVLYKLLSRMMAWRRHDAVLDIDAYYAGKKTHCIDFVCSNGMIVIYGVSNHVAFVAMYRISDGEKEFSIIYR